MNEITEKEAISSDDEAVDSKQEEPDQSDQTKEPAEEDTNIYSTDESDDGEATSQKKDDTGGGAAKPFKTSVEDRALQAILAERRRSLEMAKGVGASKFVIQRGKPLPLKSDEDNIVKNRIMNTKVHLHLSRELRQKKRLLGYQGKKEVYTDKDRAAAVTLGDQDIKTSLKVKQKNERKIMVPEDMDANVYLTEAQKNLSLGNHKAALICANKAVQIGGPEPQNLLMRSRCFLLLGRLIEALEDAQNALEEDPSLSKALLVQAEALYTMGEFERALVLFHRGNKRRPDLSAFQKGINKAREAILNAIGGCKFPKAKPSTTSENALKSKIRDSSFENIKEVNRWKSPEDTAIKSKGQKSKDIANDSTKKLDSKKKRTGGKLGGLGPQKSEEIQEKITPLITEIKTSKMASKRLLGGLSSDKEFLHKLLSRGDLALPKFQVNIESSRPGRRKSSVTVNSDEELPPGSDVVSVAQEALTSLQYLEAFLWQRDPDNLSVESKRKPSIPRRLKLNKKTTKIISNDKTSAIKSESKKTKKQTTLNTIKKKEVNEKVSNLILKLRQAESMGSLSSTLVEAEIFVEELRRLMIVSEYYAPYLIKLLTAIGKVLPRDNRGDDGVAILRDATQIAKERDLVEEYYQASDALGHVLAEVGYQDEAVEIWESLIECRQSYKNTNELQEETDDQPQTGNNNVAEKNTRLSELKKMNTVDFENVNSEEVDSGVDSRL